MAFLRFGRDKRGYEHTSLVHPIKRHGRTETRILYWYRTPPYVKVGRPALDEEAMRFLERQHPDVPFDWSRILREPPETIPEEQALRRREHRDAREAKRKKKRPAEAEGPGEGVEAPEAAAPAEPPPATTIPGSAASEVLGVQTAAHLRNRYVVLTQRIERHPDEATRAALLEDAIALDPTRWDTAEVVRTAMERYEAVYEAIRAQVGGGRRRRRRKRSRGKPGGETPPNSSV